MSLVKSGLDAVYAYRFITLMQKPFSEWEAYTLGIINDKGGVLKRPSSDKEKSAYTPFHAAIRSLKRTTQTVPMFQGISSVFQTYSAIASRYGITESETKLIERELNLSLTEDMTAGDASGEPNKIASGSTSGSVQNIGPQTIAKKVRKNIINKNKL